MKNSLNTLLKALLLTLLVAVSAQAADQNSGFKYDPNSPEALAVKAKYEGYARDGEALRTYDLHNELSRLDAVNNSRKAMATKPEDAFAAMFGITDDDMRAVSYGSVLQKRGESGDPYASFYYAAREWDMCLQFQQRSGDNWSKLAKGCWQRVMPMFKRASNAQIAAATFNIARLYENGFGVMPSKLVAAEWYVKSADQYNKEMARDDALTALESALNLVPDHPAAIRLRKAMLK